MTHKETYFELYEAFLKALNKEQIDLFMDLKEEEKEYFKEIHAEAHKE